MLTVEQSLFYKFNVDIIECVSNFLENPNEIITLRWLFAQAVPAWQGPEKERAFIEEEGFWTSYFKRMFSEVPAVFTNVQQECQDEGITLCHKVCKLAYRFYGFSNAYELTPHGRINISKLDDEERHQWLHDAVAAGYEKSLMPKATSYLPIDPVCNTIELGLKAPHRYEACKRVIYNYRKCLSYPLAQLYSVTLKDLGLLDYFIRQEKKSDPLAIQKAIKQKDDAALALLLRVGLATDLGIDDVDSEEQTPLYTAAASGHTDVVQLFLENDADVLGKTPAGNTPLHVAANVEIAQLLLQSGADVHAENDQGQTPLHMAAASDRIEVARLLLENGASLKTRTKTNNTPLHVAANVEIAQLLRKFGADVHAKNDQGQTPLHTAKSCGHTAIMEWLRTQGASAVADNCEASTPFYYCVTEDTFVPVSTDSTTTVVEPAAESLHNITLPSILVSDNSLSTFFNTLFSKDYFAPDKPMLNYIDLKKAIDRLIFRLYKLSTPVGSLEDIKTNFSEITDDDFYKILRKTLRAGYEQFFIFNQAALLNRNLSLRTIKTLVETSIQQPPCHNACKSFLRTYHSMIIAEQDKTTGSYQDNSLQLWSVILRDMEGLREAIKGRYLDEYAFIEVMRQDNVEAFQLFLEGGVDPRHRSFMQNTPLFHHAVHFNALKIVSLWLQKDPSCIDIRAATSSRGNKNSVLHGQVYVDMARLLVSCGADVNAIGYDNCTPLNDLVRFADTLETVKYLVQQGVDVNAKDEGGCTPLHWATITKNNLLCVQYLVENGAIIDATNAKEETPLHWAVESSAQKDVVAYLLSKGADINAEDKDRETPIERAIAHENIVTTQLLLEKGASIDLNRTPEEDQGLSEAMKHVLQEALRNYYLDQFKSAEQIHLLYQQQSETKRKAEGALEDEPPAKRLAGSGSKEDESID